ncbi:MAG: asparagine synthase (glutamine-hydrolyzing) [Pirellulales bacterium]
MCGICGFVNLDGRPADREIVARMNATLVHRGPDDQGLYVRGPVALGHRRLSIVDLARGHQPMSLPGSETTIVYNGEVYNHRELRERELSPGHAYQTTCDTETILWAYAEHGDGCVNLLRGMFAFAIDDPARDRVFLGRDRLGVKPLYYYQSDRLLAFASEIKALLTHPDIATSVNRRQIPVQLALKYTLDDETLFAGVRKLMPGHTMVIEGGRVERRKYWDLSYEPKSQFSSLEEASGEFAELFRDSVRARLMADVPLGVFLSGGIDSSVIAAAMSHMVTEPIKAFTVAFAERDYSELEYSRLVARHVGAEIREVVVSPEEWFAAWPHMVYHEDEPIAHPSSIPLHFVSKLAAREVKVVLTGEGSDELLAGYERYYQTLANLRYGAWVPGPLRQLSRQLIDCLPDRMWAKRKAVRTSLYLPNDLGSLFLDNYSALPRWALREALQPELLPAMSGMYDGFGQWMRDSDAENLLDQILYADMKTYLLELLMKQDQMSMSVSIESRVPFLDHHLVEFVCRLPVEYKLQGWQTKRILREALGPTIPAPIVTRSKKGFPTPTRQWFRGAYHHWIHDLLLSPHTLCHEYIQRPFIEHTLARHRTGAWDLEEQLWTLANFEIWLRLFLDGQEAETIFPASRDVLACASSG